MALSEGREMRLVATTDGLPLYEKLGFVARGDIVQHQGIARAMVPERPVRLDLDPDLNKIAALDVAASGMDRASLLATIAAQDAEKSAVFVTQGGFAMLRQFGRGQVIGPVVADTDSAAKSLIAATASHCAGQFLRIDMPKAYDLATFVETLGLAPVGGGTAMDTAPHEHGPNNMKTYALVSQALG